MPSTGTRRVVYGIQALRGVAAVGVVTHHIALALGTRSPIGMFHIGAIGVDLFFPISGIVMCLSGGALPWRTFLWRRVARIVPLYWLFTTFKLLTFAAVPGLVRRGVPSALYVVGSFLFIPVRDDAGMVAPVILAGWTLNFEMFFYLICTFVLFAAPQRFAPGVICFILAITVFGLIGAPGSHSLQVLTSPMLLEFVAGFVIALLWQRGLRIPVALIGPVILVALLWAWQFPQESGDLYGEWRPLRWGIPGAALVWCVMSMEDKVPFWRWRPLLLLGDASYAIYLGHTTVLPVAKSVLLRLHQTDSLIFAALVGVCVGFGIAIHRFVELPITRYLARLSKSFQTTAPVPVSIASTS